MRRLLLLLAVFTLAGTPAAAASFYVVTDVPTDLAGTTYLPWNVLRNDGGVYALKLALPATTPIDGLHQMCSGDWLLSVDAPTDLGGTTFDPRDVIRYNPVAGTYATIFNGAAAGVPPGSDVDVAFLNGGDSDDLILSFDVATSIGGTDYDPADLVRYSGGIFSLFFDASAAVPPVPPEANVTGADRRAGKTVMSVDVSTTLGGTTFLPGELVSWDGANFASYYRDPAWPPAGIVGDLSFLPDPGRVPPTTLRVTTSLLVPGGLTLSWGASTSVGAEDYGIYEGVLGTWYSHAAIDCNDGGTKLTEDVTPAPGNRYYLVVPLNPNDEGSYGRRSNGAERPVGTPACSPTQALGCP